MKKFKHTTTKLTRVSSPLYIFMNIVNVMLRSDEKREEKKRGNRIVLHLVSICVLLPDQRQEGCCLSKRLEEKTASNATQKMKSTQ